MFSALVQGWLSCLSHPSNYAAVSCVPWHICQHYANTPCPHQQQHILQEPADAAVAADATTRRCCLVVCLASLTRPRWSLTASVLQRLPSQAAMLRSTGSCRLTAGPCLGLMAWGHRMQGNKAHITACVALHCIVYHRAGPAAL